MEIIREIIIPTQNTYTLYLPDNMIGKQVEVIAFEIESNEEDSLKFGGELEKIKSIFKDKMVDLSHFKFDRDAANDY